MVMIMLFISENYDKQISTYAPVCDSLLVKNVKNGVYIKKNNQVENTMCKYVFFFLLSIATLQAEENPIIYLVSPPRSLSTVFLRMMDHRGDCAIFNEPTVCPYDRIHYKEFTESWFVEGVPETYVEVKEKLYEAQKNSPVFVKEVTFSFLDFLIDQPEVVKNPTVHFVFLVRHPHATAVSFYLKVEEIIDGMADLIGYEKFYKIFSLVNRDSPNSVKVIFSQELADNPFKVVKDYCEHFKLSFKEDHLHWEPYGEDFGGIKEWNESKVVRLLKLWHGNAIQSSGFVQPTVYDVDEKGHPTFAEVKNSDHRDAMMQIYSENLLWYEKFVEDINLSSAVP